MKASTLILTAGTTLALLAPAAHAGSNANRLFQTRAHTVLAEQGQKTVAKSHAAKRAA